MDKSKICESDYKFMSVIWDNEPLKSGDLVTLCYEGLGWKKSTTYTMLKKLSEKGYLKNENSTVSSLVTRDEIQTRESEYVVKSTFGGSLPAFVASFMRKQSLSDEDIEKIHSLIGGK